MERKKTDAEIKQLALDIINGHVFTSCHLSDDGSMLQSIFIPLLFIDPNDEKSGGKQFVEGLETGEISLIYEYMDKAGPRFINGYPMFCSYQTLNIEDHTALSDMINKLRHIILDA